MFQEIFLVSSNFSQTRGEVCINNRLGIEIHGLANVIRLIYTALLTLGELRPKREQKPVYAPNDLFGPMNTEGVTRSSADSQTHTDKYCGFFHDLYEAPVPSSRHSLRYS